jgi:CDP-4-dehydro-6-deoxyglucose reductase
MLKLIQQAGRWMFMRVESGFNALFGESWNPLYYLGAIAFFMLWVVVGSGLYIYAFYTTSVTGAYASVEYLTHTQWYFGGVLRSLHRYASDGMVLFSLLHLARNFAYDRYRGFRWFSWVSGVMLLWLIYMSGINGYWLVWDKLAQFIAIATTEWLDWLPIFSAPLVRNFLFEGAVNDRFFSLLAFLHIGIPLVLVILSWVHIQRVQEAKIIPPRHITVSLIAVMLVLAFVKPAVSQGGIANLNSVPTALGLDWFFLANYPLLYIWGPAKLWFLVWGATLVLMVLPWLGKRAGTTEFKIVSMPPCEHSFIAQPGETVLEAALRQNLPMPYVCRDGACGVCKGQLIKGKVDYGTYLESALSETERREGKVLFCCATPLTDLEIACQDVAELKDIPVRKLDARVEKMQRAAHDVMVLHLQLESAERLRFLAGQYINILPPDGKRRSFSIANPPHDNALLQLHIRHVAGGSYTGHVFNEMKPGDTLHFEGPLGSFFLHDEGDKPIIFLASSCGFAPIKAMLEHAFHVGIQRKMTLYWGIRSRRDLYMGELPEQWAKEHDNFTFIPVLSEPAPEDDWHGRSGLVHEAILADLPDLSGYQVYACGNPIMVELGYKAFTAHGLPENEYYSDAFIVTSAAASKPRLET